MNKIIFLLLIAVICTSCASTGKDIVIDSDRIHEENDLSRLETAIVPLEAAGGTETRRRHSEAALARQMISGMERTATADADYSGKLIAWSGRLSIIEGRYSEAQRLYRQSAAVSPGNVPSVILGIRLEGDPAIRLEMIERELVIAGRSGTGELQIERGRALFELNRFSESAGAFDTAFSSGINPVYNESYMTVRNQAWELRNTSGIGAGTFEMLGRESVTWNDSITLAKSETQLLRFLTGGRDLPNAELFSRLLDRAFIPFTQDINVNEWSNAKPRIDEAVTRAGAAWFIWHLYAESRADRGLLSRYSARYATGVNPRSPIADVPPLSPFFDSILGCVETEFLSLPDGRNFRASHQVRGAELLTILRRMDN